MFAILPKIKFGPQGSAKSPAGKPSISTDQNQRDKALALVSCLALGVVIAIAGCTGKRAELGSAKNPVKLFFTPSVDAKLIEDNSKVFKAYLESHTPYKFEVGIPQSYVAVIEAFGTARADVAAMNTFGYLIANEKYGTEARLTVIRNGSATYQSQIITRSDAKISKLEDLKGKKLAFVDPLSTSGYLLPLKMLKDRNIEFKESTFAGKHDNVVTMVYQKQVDAGATFHSPPKDGKLEDARRLVKTQFPDVEQKVKILELSEGIPNDPIIFRKDMPEDMKAKITEAFLTFVQSEEGKAAFEKIYNVTALKKASDADYEGVKAMLKSLGKSANDFMKK